MAKRPRQPKLIKLGDVLQSVLKGRNMTITSEKQHLQKIWSQAVGSQIAGQTCPDRLKKNALFVKVSSPIWMQQLHFLKEDIIDKINRQMGEALIKNILFSVGEISRTSRISQDPVSFFPASFSLKGRDKKMVEESIASVSDEELKEILKRIMIKDILRKKISGSRKVP
jgi:hypothetical protein